jgi:hypothetical protein
MWALPIFPQGISSWALGVSAGAAASLVLESTADARAVFSIKLRRLQGEFCDVFIKPMI